MRRFSGGRQKPTSLIEGFDEERGGAHYETGRRVIGEEALLSLGVEGAKQAGEKPT